MSLFQDNETNWRYILIIVVLATIIGAGIFYLSAGQEFLFPGLLVGMRKDRDKTNDWNIYEGQNCGFEIRYPFDWEPEPDCLSSFTNDPYFESRNFHVYCLKSSDFKGYLGGVPSNIVEQGQALVISCDEWEEEFSSELMLNGCLEDKQTFSGERNICEIEKKNGLDFIHLEPGHYKLIKGKILYTITIESQLPTPIIDQILSTFVFVENSKPEEIKGLIDQAIGDLKGEGKLQLVTFNELTPLTSNPVVRAGVVRIFTDETQEILEWESEPISLEFDGSLSVIENNPVTGAPVIEVSWGAGAHGTEVLFIYWFDSQFQKMGEFFSDAGGVYLDNVTGKVFSYSRDYDCLFSEAIEYIYEWDGNEYQLVETIRPECP